MASSFCGQCGIKFDDLDSFCGSCGLSRRNNFIDNNVIRKEDITDNKEKIKTLDHFLERKSEQRSSMFGVKKRVQKGDEKGKLFLALPV